MIKTLVIIAVIIFGAIGFYFYYISGNQPQDQANSEINKLSYTNISSVQLSEMLKQKDFKLVDVHIPEQQHVPGTDNFIAYNEVEKFVAQFPNKDEKIVLYCRSGGMSRTLAEDLIERGYSNILNLEGGMNGWQAAGNPTTPIGSLQY